MSGYAARYDGLGWHAADDEDDCTDEEYFTEVQPSLAPFEPKEKVLSKDSK